MKKTFNPGIGRAEDSKPSVAMNYITQRQEELERENKTKRVNALIKPSTHDKLYKISVMSRTSVNDIINRALEEFCDTHQDKVNAYEQTFCD